MKIIILGCGYLGYNINKIFKKKYNCEIWGLKNYYSDKCDNFKEIDIFNIADEDLKDTIIIDCISLISNTEDDINKLKMVEEKYSGLLKKFKEKNIKRFIMLSSGGTIYGDSFKPINEKHHLHPESVYAKSKYLLEKMLKKSGLNYLVLRPTNPYGGEFEPGKLQGIIGILIKCAFNNKVFHLWADDESIRDYIYITDFVYAIKALIDKDINNETVNISSSQGSSIKKVINIIERLTDKKIKIDRCDINVPVIKAIVLSNEKLKKLTGYEVKIGLEEGIGLEVERIKEEMK